MITLDFHSPVEPLDISPFSEKGLTVHVKRDDMIHPFISGNKWRKLKYILRTASARNKTHLVTFGGAWSNHLLATACAGAKFGFGTTAFVRGEPVINPSLSMCKLFGMELRFTDRAAYRNKPALYEKHFGGDEKAYFIDEGGFAVEGMQGCAEMIDELALVYDHIFCACGTGTTLAGLYKGINSKGLGSQLHGIPVLAGGEFIRSSIAEWCPDTAPENIILHTDYHFGGYAKTSAELNNFIKAFCAQTGMMIEPVYTGKLFYGVSDLAANGYFHAGEKILIIHTGGLTGFLGMHDRLT